MQLPCRMILTVFLIASVLGSPGAAGAQDNPLANFIKKLFQADETVGEGAQRKRLPARQAGEDGGDLFYGERTLSGLAVAIKKYEKIVSGGGWELISSGPPLRYGDEDKRIPAIRKRLMITGDLPADQTARGHEYDTDLHKAVVRFQTRHGLPNSGFFGKQTRAALNVQAKTRLGQLRKNLERVSRLSAIRTTGRAIVVNIPGYELQAVNDNRVVFSSRVVVGRKDRQTPTLSAQIRAVNLMPVWRVPQSIAKRDLIPRLRSDPDYFSRERFRILGAANRDEIAPRAIDWASPDAMNLRFEQAPGPNNALGLIRLDMPNDHAVYLHDTPLKKLFETTARPFSSGCVRVQKIADVTAWLIATEEGWDAAKLANAIRSGRPQTIKLSVPIPVHFIYLTAWVEPDGDINFREDIYKLDGATPAATSYVPRSVPVQPVTP